LRTLLIHGARAALGRAGGKQDPRSRWLGKLRRIPISQPSRLPTRMRASPGPCCQTAKPTIPA
jgi:hypothetical protein